MKLIDTHAHLQFEAYDDDRDEVVKRNSKELDVIINVGARIESSKSGVELAQKIPNFYAAVGVHPHHEDEWKTDWIYKLENLAKKPKVVAIGEIGLDKHKYRPLRVLRSNELQDYPKPNLKKQEKILKEQVELARKLDLPILLHCRKAYDELYESIKEYNDLRGLVHCFMGTIDQAKKFLDLGLYISFSGNLTYKGNDYIREAAKSVPLDKILVETDAPYLPPEPHRGTRNEPYRVRITAEKLAEVKKVSFDKISEITNKNSRDLLNL